MGLRQKITLIFLALSFCARVFAEKTLDNALRLAGADIARMCGVKDILVIDDFASPSAKMTEYIREQLGDLIYAHDGLVRIVTRDKLSQQMTERERRFQNSGVVDESTILSVAKRLGARNVVFGTFEEVGGDYILRVRMISVETDAYIFRKSYTIPRSSIDERTFLLLDWKPLKNFNWGSLGLGFEVNKNSIDYVAPAVNVAFDYALGDKFSIGAHVILGYDFHGLFTFETFCTFRFYPKSPFLDPNSGFFIEAQVGLSALVLDSDANAVFNAGGAVGFRRLVNFGSLYLEPSLRVGYPYMFAVGFSAGLEF